MNGAVIPARGGSKPIPRKNIREFAGKPMIVPERRDSDVGRVVEIMDSAVRRCLVP